MNPRTYIVTGANSGIGKAIATAIAKEKARVVMVCRNSKLGNEALAELRKETGNTAVELVVGDLGSVAGCKMLAATLLEKYPEIHCLVNNAGIWMTSKELNEDGLEKTFMVNHMAPFILSNLLLERLKKNAPARIVNVNSALYYKGKVDLDKLPTGKNYSRIATYADTKLANMLFTQEFARRIAGSGVTINAVHPGVIRTRLGESSGLRRLVLQAFKVFMGKPEEGAAGPVRLALAPELETTSGKYFFKLKEHPITRAARDEKMAADLWALSVKLARSNREKETPMKTIALSATFNASPAFLYKFFLDSKLHSEITGAKAKVNPKAGGKFTAWDGYITGKTVALVKNKKIVQEWRSSDFSDGDTDSILELGFTAAGKEKTRLSLKHSGLPAGSAGSYKDGWREYYIMPLKAYLKAR